MMRIIKSCAARLGWQSEQTGTTERAGNRPLLDQLRL